MRVILLRDIPQLGNSGTIKDVADGYALNFLIPKGLAVEATQKNLAQHKKIQETAIQHKEKEDEAYEILRRATEGKTIVILKPADAKGNLYAGVSAKDILQALRTAKFPLPTNLQENNIIIDAPIKVAGEHQITIKNPSGNFVLAIRVESKKRN